MGTAVGILGGGIAVLALYGWIFSNWKRGVYALILFLPFAGVPTMVFYPAPPITRLLKDLLFIAPLYLTFSLWALKRRSRWRLPARIAPPLVAVVVIVILQMFNPREVSFLAALVGFKLWMSYIPLLWVGRALARNYDDVWRVTKYVVASALIPVAVGIAQAVLVYSGRRELAYGLFGEEAAFSATQGFYGTDFGTGLLLTRIPSLFTSFFQYFWFLLCVLPFACAAWVIARQEKHHARRYTWMLAAVIVGAFLSGSRAAFVIMPGFVALWGLFGARRFGTAVKLAAIMGAALTAVTSALGASFSGVANVLVFLILNYTVGPQAGEFSRAAAQAGYFGTGTGMSSGPVRFVAGQEIDGTHTPPLVFEGFHAKTFAELGVIGLAATVLLFGGLIWQAVVVYRSLQDRRLKVLSLFFTAFLVTVVVYLWKASFIDYDPGNVYFWLVAGLASGLRVADARLRAHVPLQPQPAVAA